MQYGSECAKDIAACYGDLRPIGDYLWFSIPERIGLAPENIVVVNCVAALIGALFWAFVLKRILFAWRGVLVNKVFFSLLLFISLAAHAFFLRPTVFNSLSDPPASVMLLLGIGCMVLSGIQGGQSVVRAGQIFFAGIFLGAAAWLRAFYLYPVLICVFVSFSGYLLLIVDRDRRRRSSSSLEQTIQSRVFTASRCTFRCIVCSQMQFGAFESLMSWFISVIALLTLRLQHDCAHVVAGELRSRQRHQQRLVESVRKHKAIFHITAVLINKRQQPTKKHTSRIEAVSSWAVARAIRINGGGNASIASSSSSIASTSARASSVFASNQLADLLLLLEAPLQIQVRARTTTDSRERTRRP